MIYLVTGGSGSGKSAYAESLLSGFENIRSRYYIATMQVYGEEGKRVERHRRLRAGKGFITSEQTVQIEQALKNLKTVIRCHMQHLLSVCLILLPMKCSMKMDSEARTKL